MFAQRRCGQFCRVVDSSKRTALERDGAGNLASTADPSPRDSSHTPEAPLGAPFVVPFDPLMEVLAPFEPFATPVVGAGTMMLGVTGFVAIGFTATGVAACASLSSSSTEARGFDRATKRCASRSFAFARV